VAPNRLWLIRHGQSEWNASGRWQGQADPPLSQHGHHQAALLAERLAKLSPAALYTSDLRRAAQTAAPLAEVFGRPAIPRADLREVDIGGWAGKTYDEIVAAFPDEIIAWQAGEDVARGGGERYTDLARRAVGFLDHLRHHHDGEDVVAVTHGGWIRAVLTHILDLDHNHPGLGGNANTGITVLRYLPTGLRLVTHNDQAHLDGISLLTPPDAV
jgi:broad specificity phosphatase PhoE